MESFFSLVYEYFQTDGTRLAEIFCTLWRYAAPLLALLILWRCAKPLLKFQREPETWAWLVMPDGNQLPITHWENIIGRARGCDIVVDFPTVSRNHAVLTRYDDGSWSITDIGSRGAVMVNGEQTALAAVEYGDRINLGGVEMVLTPVTQEEIEDQLATRTRPQNMGSPGLTLFFLTLFQLFTAFQFVTHLDAGQMSSAMLGFSALIAVEWFLFLALKLVHRSGYEVETLAFFLCTIGFSVIASDDAQKMGKQLIALLGGIVIYLVIGWSMRNLSRAKRFRYLAAVGGLLLPPFIIMVFIAGLFGDVRTQPQMAAFLRGVRPAIIALLVIPVARTLRHTSITLANVWLPIGAAVAICLLGLPPFVIVLGIIIPGLLYGFFIKPNE